MTTAKRPTRQVAGPRFGAMVNERNKPPSPEPMPIRDVAEEATTFSVNIFALTSTTCRWPLWDMKSVPSPFDDMYCGAEAVIPGRYCAFHCGVAFNRK